MKLDQIKNSQLSLSTEETQPVKTCAFTGHRTLSENFSPRKTKALIKKLIESGVDTFYNGMALGFDLFTAEAVLSLKKKYPHVKLIACVPCHNQEKSFPEQDKKRYVKVLKKADETIVLSPTYFTGCMQKRNRFMADNADVLVAYCHSDEGGAAYTVKYFKKIKPTAEILFI